MQTMRISTPKGTAEGYKIDLGLPLIVIKGAKGYLACGYISRDVVEKVGDCCAIVSGVKDFGEMLVKPVKWASPKAMELGIREGMVGKQALELLF